MADASANLKVDELRGRIAAAGITIPEARLGLVLGLLADALRPIRAADWRADKTLGPTVTFDAAQAAGGADGR